MIFPRVIEQIRHLSSRAFAEPQFTRQDFSDSRAAHAEVLRHNLGERKRILFEERAEAVSHHDHWSSGALGVLTGSIAGFETGEPSLDGRKRHSLSSKQGQQLRVNRLSPELLEPEKFDHESLLGFIL
jgi:hypothetical protein